FGFDNYNITDIGTNAKLQEINCAIGCRQINRLEDRLNLRRARLNKYKQELSDFCRFQDNDDLSTVAFASALLDTGSDAIVKTLQDMGISVRKYYSPLHRSEVLSGYTEVAEGGLSNTDHIWQRIIALPVHDNMDDKDITSVIKELKKCL